jgi:hypothetical protein
LISFQTEVLALFPFMAEYICSMRRVLSTEERPNLFSMPRKKGVNESSVGDVYKMRVPTESAKSNDFQADEEFVGNQWGLGLTANAPIHTRQKAPTAASLRSGGRDFP